MTPYAIPYACFVQYLEPDDSPVEGYCHTCGGEIYRGQLCYLDENDMVHYCDHDDCKPEDDWPLRYVRAGLDE